MNTPCSLLSKATFDALKTFSGMPPLEPDSVKLRTYTGEVIKTLGSMPVTLERSGHIAMLPYLVVEGTGPNVIGRNWRTKLFLGMRLN